MNKNTIIKAIALFAIIIISNTAFTVITEGKGTVHKITPSPCDTVVVTVNSPTYCRGGSSTLTAGGAATYTWAPATGLNQTTGTSVTCNATVTTTYTVTGISSNGCTVSATSIVTVNPIPGDNAGRDTAICASSTVKIGATSTAGHTYSWSPSTNLNITTVSNPTYTANTSNSTYTLTETITATGCSAHNTVAITAGVLSPLKKLKPITMCSGKDTIITVLSSYSTYRWSPSAGLSSSTVYNPTASPTVSTTYTLAVTNSFGCTGSTTEPITISGVAPAATVGSNQTICDVGSVTLGTSSQSGHTYVWSPSTGLSSSTISNPTANPTITNTYTLTETITATSCAASKSVIVTVSTTPTVAAHGSSTTICTGSNTTLTGSGATTYSWSPATNLSSSTGATVTATPTVTTTYTVVGTNGGICTASATVVVTVNPLPTVTANTSANSICSGSSVTLTGSGTATSYMWDNSVTDGVAFSPSSTTTYYVTGTDDNGCSATNSVTVTVIPIVHISPAATTVCYGTNAILNAPGGYTSYEWSNGATTSADTIEWPTDLYKVTVTGTGGCTSTDSAQVNFTEIYPSGINANSSGTSAVITWNANSCAQYYKISYRDDHHNNFQIPDPITDTTYTLTGLNPQTNYNVQVQGWNNGSYEGMSFRFTTGCAAPVITTNINDTTINTNSAFTFTVGETNSDFTYQWYEYDESSWGTLSDNDVYSGSNTATLTVTPPYAVISTYKYRCTVSNGCDSSVTSNEAQITMQNPSPIMATSGNITVCAGLDGQIFVSATGDILSYQWAVDEDGWNNNLYDWTDDGDNGGNFYDVICWGTNTDTLHIYNPSQTHRFICTVTNLDGSFNSDYITVTASTNPLSVHVIPSVFCVGSDVKIYAANDSSNTYNWDKDLTNARSVQIDSTITYHVSVTDNNNCIFQDSISITPYEANLSLGMVSSHAYTMQGSLCAGDQVKVGAGGMDHIVWADGVTEGAWFTPNSTATYHVTGTNNDGCVRHDSITINVYSGAPQIVTPPIDKSGCVYDTLKFSSKVTGPDLRYAWVLFEYGGGYYTTGNHNDVAWGVFTDSVNFIPKAVRDTFALDLDSIALRVNNACGDVVSNWVRVNTFAPAINISTSSNPVCTGAGETLTASGNAVSYVWDNDVTNEVEFSAPSDTIVYHVVGTDVHGCTATDTVTVEVSGSVPQITSISNSVTTCAGNTVLYKVNAIGVNLTYQWQQYSFNPVSVNNISDNDTFSGTNSDSLVVTANASLNNTYYRCVVSNDCGSPQSDWSQLTVGSPARLQLTDTSICAGNAITLIVGNDSTTATWDNGVTDGVSFIPSQTTTYHVVADNNNCTITDSITITVNSAPTLTATASADTVCAGSSLRLTGSGGFTSYSWDNGVTDGVSFAPSSTATYHVIGTDGNGCSATDSTTITVNSKPTVSITTTPGKHVCPGVKVTVTASGASTYQWDAQIINGQPFSPQSGTNGYFLTATDSNGCKTRTSVTIQVYSSPVITVTPSDTTVCAGQQVTMHATGGVFYNWNNGLGGSRPTAAPDSTTTYTVKGTDNDGCTANATTIVTVNPLPTVTANTSANAVCAGGSVTLTGSGNASSYTWDNDVTDSVAVTPLNTTTYNVTGTNGNGCSATDTITIAVSSITADTSKTNVLCYGDSTGIATIIVAGGITPYTYLWSNTKTTASITGLAAGIYTVTATDKIGCSITKSLTLTQPAAALAVTVSVTPACTSFTTIAVATPTGGTPNYTYFWTNRGGIASSATVSGTNRTVTVTDANGCTASKANVSWTPVLNTLSGTMSKTPVSCYGGSNGTATANITGTYTPFTYAWTPDAGTITATTATITGLTAQHYALTVTDAKACTLLKNVTVLQSASELTISPGSTTNVTCHGGNNGSATVTLSGGTTPYTYSWSNNATTATISNLVAGTYTVTGTDAYGCSLTQTFIITQPNALAVTANASSTSVCAGSNVTLTGSGASTYVWDNNVTDGVAFAPSSTTTYHVTGTNANGCTAKDSITITVNPLPTVSIHATHTAICPGAYTEIGANGNAVSYVWDNGLQNNGPVWLNTTTVFHVTASSSGGCTAKDSITIHVNVPAVTANAVKDSVCPGESVTLFGSGSPATYTWSSGVTNNAPFVPSVSAIYYVTATDSIGCTNTNSIAITLRVPPTVVANTSAAKICPAASVTLTGSGAATYTWSNDITDGVAFTPLQNGTYNVTGTDIYGCSNTANVAVTIDSVHITARATHTAICPGAYTEFSAAGNGVSHTWDHGLEADGPVWLQATTTYHVTAYSSVGCIAKDSITIHVNVPAVTANAVKDSVCPGESVTLYGSGDAATYIWSGGITNNEPFVPSVSAIYYVTATDSIGCTNTNSIAITLRVPPTIVANTSAAKICPAASVTLTGSGAATYVWSNDITDGVAFTPLQNGTYNVTGTDIYGCSNTANVAVTIDSVHITARATHTAICPGAYTEFSAAGNGVSHAWDHGLEADGPVWLQATTTYHVTAYSSVGCVAKDSITIHVNVPAVTANAVKDSVCPGESVTLYGSGDAATYIWSGGITNNEPFVPSVSAIYYATATDSIGCTNTNSIAITLRVPPTVVANTSAAKICPAASVTLTGSGAATYTWSNDITDGVAFTPLQNDKYYVTGTDKYGCSNTANITVIIDSVHVSSHATHTAICPGAYTEIGAIGNGVSYVWDNGLQNNGPVWLNATTVFHVMAYSSIGCIAKDSITIHVNVPVVTANAVKDSVCRGESVTLYGSGDAATYTWSNGVTNNEPFVPSVSTIYYVTATDSIGCRNTNSIGITLLSKPTVVANSSTKNVCIGGSVTLTASGNATSYTWDNDVQDGVAFTPTKTTTYHLTGINGNGCSAIDSVTVTIDTAIVIATVDYHVVCRGGWVYFGGRGNAETYSWDNNIENNNNYNPDSTKTYHVTGTDANGCTASDSVTVTINQLPYVQGNATAYTVCAGDSVTLYGSGDPVVSYTWTDDVIDGQSFVPTESHLYFVTATDSNGCQNQGYTGISYDARPVVTATASAKNVCTGTAVTLNVNGTPLASVSWDNDVTNGQSFVPSGTAVYHIIGIDGYGCSNKDSITVTVNSLPVVTASASSNSVCRGENVTLTGGGAVSYTWDNNVTNNIAFADTATATFTITGTDGNNCTDTASIQVVVKSMPVITCPSNVSVTAPTGQCQAAVNFAAAIYGPNILVNGGAEDGFNGWTINQNAGDGWLYAPYASGPRSGSNVFNTSYDWDVMEQTVDLVANGYTADYLDKSPAISVSEWYKASDCCSPTDRYFFAAELRDSSNNIIASFNLGDENYPVQSTQTWQQAYHAFSGYPAGARFVRIVHGGADNEYWLGNYGTSIDDAEIKVALPDTIIYSVKPGSILPIGVTHVVASTNTSCGIDSASFDVTVLPAPAPVINGPATICHGSTGVLDAGEGYTIYHWNTGDSTQIINVIGGGDYSVTVTSEGGCTATSAISITDLDLPNVIANTTLNSICIGTNITLWGTGNADFYMWDNDAEDNIGFGPQITTNYHVTGMAGNGCTATDSIVIHVNNLPNVTATASAENICLGGKETLTGGGAQTYKWSSNAANGVAFYPVESQLYTVTGTDSNGCVNQASVQVNINKAPAVKANASASPVCKGTNVTLTGSGAVSYSWSSNVTDGVAFNPAITATYRVVGTDVNGCTGAANTTITVNAPPAVSVQASPTAVCAGRSVTLTAKGAQTYTWNNNVENGVAFIPSSTNTYQVVGTDIHGCSKSVNVTVTVNNLPAVMALASVTEICNGSSVTLNGKGASLYMWELEGVKNGVAFAPSATTTYHVTGIDSKGCRNTDSVTITVSNVPAASVASAATNVSSTGFTANWNTTATATGYYIDVATDKNFNTLVSGYTNLFAGNNTSYDVQNLALSTVYYYRVKAANNCGSGKNSDTVSCTTKGFDCSGVVGGTVTPANSVVCPSSSQQLTCTGAIGGMLQWQVSNDNLTWTNINGATGTNYTTGNIIQKQYFRSVVVSAACYNVASTTAIVDVSVKPTVTISSVTATSVAVSWTPFAPSQYNIAWSGTYSGVINGVRSLPYTIETAPNSDLQVTVTPAGLQCNGVNAGIASVHTPCDKPSITSLNPVNAPAHGFKVNWTGTNAATSYRIYYRDLAASTSWSFVDTTGTSKTIIVPAGGKTYAVYIAANNCPLKGVYGDGSIQQYVTTLPLPSCIAVPTVTAVSNCPNQISVNINGGSGQYYIKLREISPAVSTGAGYIINGSSVNITLGGAFAGSTWEVYASSVCSGVKSPPSNVAVVTLRPACPPVSNVVISKINCGGFTVSWNANDCNRAGITGYQLLIKKSGTLNYTAYNIDKDNTYDVINWLTGNTSYDVAVRTTSCNNAVSGLSAPVSAKVLNCTRIDEADDAVAMESKDESVVVYPNPAQYQFMVDIGRKDLTEATVKIELLNPLGQIMQTTIAPVTNGHLNQVMNLEENIASGIYFVKTTVGNNIYVNRIVLNKQ